MTQLPAPTDVAMIRPILRSEAHDITLEEGRRFASIIGSLEPARWSRPTDCERWSVHDVVAHVVGSAAAQASPREFIRQVRRGRRFLTEIGATDWWDGANEVQVRDRQAASADDLVAEWRELYPRAARARARLPRVIARAPVLKLPDPIGRQPIAYLFDMGFTRDTWVHRFDVARAVEHDLTLDDHDRRIVADIIAEWADTHDADFDLVLADLAGARFSRGGHGAQTTHTTLVELCRALSGRTEGVGVLRHPLPL